MTTYVPGTEEKDLAKVIMSLQQLATRTGSREKLTVNRTYYVRTDGSDTNNGLSNSSTGAFLTIQKAINTVVPLDLGGFAVSISVGAGTYVVGCTLTVPIIGGVVTISGDNLTPSNVIISTTGGGNCFLVNGPGVYLQVSGFKLQTAGGGVGLYAQTSATLQALGAIEFGDCTGGTHCAAHYNGTLIISNGAANTISGGATNHLVSSGGSKVFVNSNTITVTGTPAFANAFVNMNDNSVATFISTTITGAATGTRYLATNGGGIDTNGGGANFFPGNVAGSATSPGWYA